MADLPEFCSVIDMSRTRYGSQRFLDEFVLPSRPVVLRGLPPLGRPFRAQDDLFQELADTYGEQIITAFAHPPAGHEKTEGAASPPARPALPAEVPMELQDLVALLQRNTSSLGALVFGEHLNLDRELPKLANAIAQEQQANGPPLLSKLPFRRVNLRLAPIEDGVWEPLHFDGHDSLLYQLQCGKEVLLFPPGESEKLPYAGGAAGFHDEQWTPAVLGSRAKEHVTWHRSPTLHASRSAVTVDFERPDLDQFPRLAEALPPRRCTVRSGEALFLPAFWHWQGLAFGGGDAGPSCTCVDAAVDFWYRPLHSEPTAAEAASASLARDSEL